MARGRGNRKDSGNPAQKPRSPEGEPAGRVPEFVRRALSVGLSGFFFTEEALRKALGETLPRDWTDFAVEQSERTRREFLERLSFELAQSLEKIDFATVLRELLEGRTLEVRAEIRLGGDEPQRMHAALRPTEEDE